MTNRTTTPMIAVTDLSKRYGDLAALSRVSFQVHPGEIYGLLGPNGAGKSTALNIISGVLTPSSGRVTVGEYDVTKDPSRAKKLMGVVPQDSILVEQLGAFDNCMFFGSLYGVEKSRLKARAAELLGELLPKDRLKEPVSQYSGGMMRRLTLALGILHEPAALILDEPTVGLDPQTRLHILAKIRKLADGGTAVLMSTHYLDEAERCCDRVGIIDDGRIIEEGTLPDLRSQIEDVQIVSFRGGFDHAVVSSFVEGVDGGLILKSEAEETVVSLPTGTRTTTRLLEVAAALRDVREIAVKPPSLESLFIKLTGRELRD